MEKLSEMNIEKLEEYQKVKAREYDEAFLLAKSIFEKAKKLCAENVSIIDELEIRHTLSRRTKE